MWRSKKYGSYQKYHKNNIFQLLICCNHGKHFKLTGSDQKLHEAGMQFFLLMQMTKVLIQPKQPSKIEVMDKPQSYGTISTTDLEKRILQLFTRRSDNTG